MIAFAAFFMAWVHQHRRDPVQTHAAAAEALAIADRYGYPHIAAWACALDGWATGLMDDAGAGESMIRTALATTDAIGVTLIRPNFLANLAELQLRNAGPHAALATLDSARAIAERTEERCYLPEILRLRAECLLRADARAVADARQILDDALQLARTHQAAGFEPAIRATASSLA